VARDLGVRLGSWSFEVQGDLDTSVLVGGADGNANFDRVTVRATVETDASNEQFATLVAETERRCPVTQLSSAAVSSTTVSGRTPPCPGPTDTQATSVPGHLVKLSALTKPADPSARRTASGVGLCSTPTTTSR
jgi:hypothetical protein